jgi:hypothetical protein
MPSGLVVTKGSKIVFATSAATPGPESATEISMACSFFPPGLDYDPTPPGISRFHRFHRFHRVHRVP